MKLPFVCSLVLHGLLVLGLLILPAKKSYKIQKQDIYQVQLVAISQPQTSKEKPEAVPIKKIETVVKKVRKKEIIKEHKKPAAVKKTVETKEINKSGAAVEPVLASGSSDVKVDIKNFPFAYYLSLIQYRVKKNWRPPLQAIGSNAGLTATIVFTIRKNGQIEQVKVEQSSSRFLFDQAARRAISTMLRLPPLPGDFREENLRVHIEFESK